MAGRAARQPPAGAGGGGGGGGGRLGKKNTRTMRTRDGSYWAVR